MTHPEDGRFLWHKSTYSSAQGQCVEVADNLPQIVGVRDSKNPNGPAHVVSRSAWCVFVRAVVASRL